MTCHNQGMTMFRCWHTSSTEGKVTILRFLPVEIESAQPRPPIKLANWSAVICMLRLYNKLLQIICIYVSSAESAQSAHCAPPWRGAVCRLCRLCFTQAGCSVPTVPHPGGAQCCDCADCAYFGGRALPSTQAHKTQRIIKRCQLEQEQASTQKPHDSSPTHTQRTHS